MKHWTRLCIIFLFSLPAYAADRIALVIGNNAYQGTARLNNPINDAKAMAAAFKRMGFRVFLHKNTTSAELSDALDSFGEAAEQAKVAVVFYAGHGIQVDGENYLIPTNVSPKKQRDLRKLLRLDDLMAEVAHASKLGVILLDACRDNPFASRLGRSLGRSIGGRGLARVEQTTGNVLVSFATAKDHIALDGTGKYSPYTQALLANIETSNDIRKVLGQVRDDVQASTQKSQIPYVYGSLGGGDYCLTQHCLNSNKNKVIPSQTAEKTTKQRAFEPKMKFIRGGRFLMGSPADEKGRGSYEKQHHVSVKDFWLGQYEVTFAEWDACVTSGGCTYKPEDAGWGRDQRPVINVSWNDVQVYIAWLNKQTGKNYRLATEAEWEYAARAGTT